MTEDLENDLIKTRDNNDGAIEILKGMTDLASKSKTIKLLLSDGTLQGLLVVEDSHWNKGTLLSAPRTSIDELMRTNEIDQWGVYLLLSEEKVYVGQTSNFKKRLYQHNINKDWWEKVVILTTNDDSFTKSDIDYLESSLIEKARVTGSLENDNKNSGNISKVGKFREPELIQYIDEALLLLELIGISVFVGKRVLKQRKIKQLTHK